jgi:hypothetical protein
LFEDGMQSFSVLEFTMQAAGYWLVRFVGRNIVPTRQACKLFRGTRLRTAA